MSTGTLLLVDKELRSLGKITIERSRGDLRVGRFEPQDFPNELRALCDEYQDLVESQVFAALDRIELELEAVGFGVLEEGSGVRTPIADLQITRDNRISYRTSAIVR
ncbi:hypothetical protein WMF04_07160 [Sorangium sp. So ce260]|uniref:hypothetical protein n=1 Tax=Sorangium sp. So ce260 TaxID=3133291 RepID=UPI003F6095B8